MIDVVFDASIAEVLDDHMSDQRLKDALFGQGIIGAYGGPKDAGTASIKLMHYQGDLEGQGPVWGYVQGGMGMVSFAIADAAQRGGRHARRRRAGGGDRARGGRRARGRHAASARAPCSATPTPRSRCGCSRARTCPPTTARASRTGRSAARWSSSTPRSTRCPTGPRRPARRWPARATIDVTGGLEDAQRAFEALRARRARRRLRRDLHPDRLRPVARARRASTC